MGKKTPATAPTDIFFYFLTIPSKCLCITWAI